MGIDGWIYIAVGDFGIHGAKGTDGTELTMLGGGVVRFRPDGSEMEVYTHGLRNIYDVVIDPFMNIYTRGNTNDGGGWNVRFIHPIQSGEYGYPVLFKNFTDEIIPALVDVGGPNSRGALWALKRIHDLKAVDGLIAKYDSASAEKVKAGILATLIRLYQIEAPYDGSWWWSTRPDTRGPYYKPIKWDGSEKIAAFVKAKFAAGEQQGTIIANNTKTRSAIEGIDAGAVVATPAKPDEPKVDLSAIARAKGQVGKMSIEDVMLALDDIKGDAKKGELLFTRQGCIACHSTSADQPAKGPYMGQVGSILSREQIAESILKPNASISQGFATVSLATKDGKSMVGFISAQTADDLEMRDIAGQVHKFKNADIKTKTELEISMMPPGLANALSMEEFASLVAYLAGNKG